MRISLATALVFISLPVSAQTIESVYTQLDFEKNCTWTFSEDPIEASMGGSAVCDGLPGYPVYLAEGDLRQFVLFGPVVAPDVHTGGFMDFNYVNNVIEWRMKDGKPFATILRWFLETPDATEESPIKSQILVVSTVARPDAPDTERVSCQIAYIDALANADANVLAREVADAKAEGFTCGAEWPEYVGERGAFSGFPADLLE